VLSRVSRSAWNHSRHPEVWNHHSFCGPAALRRKYRYENSARSSSDDVERKVTSPP